MLRSSTWWRLSVTRGKPFSHHSLGRWLPEKGERASKWGSPHPALYFPTPPPGRSEDRTRARTGKGQARGSPPTMDRASVRTHTSNFQNGLVQASLKPERVEERTETQEEDSPDQMACFHLQRTGVVLPGLLVGEGELRKTRMGPYPSKGARDGTRVLEGG